MDLSIFEDFAYFTNKDFEAFLNKKNSPVYLTQLSKENKIIKIEKGKYTLHEDPLIYITTLTLPSYLSGLSALNYYNLTTQIPIHHTIITPNQKKPIPNISFIKIKKEYFFGYKKINYKNFDIFIAEKEKLLIDCLYLDLGVNISELERLLEENLNTKKIINYLQKIDNISLIKRVGYLLEKKNNTDIYNKFKDKILLDKNYIKLEKNLPKKDINNSKWKLIINT